jgi:glyceraldehyde 3-phosphate dehydrogenase
MTIRIGINGFGRIGRCVARIAAQNPNIDLVAINDLTSSEQLAYLFKYDSTHGKYAGTVTHTENSITVDGDTMRVFAERDPANIPWGDLGVDYVLECTGIFKDKDKAMKHIQAGAKFVLVSAPGKGLDMTFVKGVNHEKFTPDMTVIDVASCTTNCLAPIAKVLNDSFGIEQGLMTTIHSYTNDQGLLDAPHPSDFRRARAAAVNMVITTTGAAIAVTKALPELKGKLDGTSIRVPTPNVSCVDLVATFEKPVSVEAINAAMKAAAEGPLKGILAYTDEPLVSSDMMNDPHSSIFDSQATMVLGDKMAKVISWYDNEWGYSARMIDAVEYVDAKRK